MHDHHDRPGDGGLARLGRDEDPPIDAERDPGGARHLATGAGGAGDWIASAAGIGQRRGPADDDRPFDVDDDATGWAAGGDRHDRDEVSPTVRVGQDRVGDEHGGEERGGEEHDDAPSRAPARNAGPNGWQRSDPRIHDDVRERLSRSHLDAGDVSVEVHDGHVTLSGTVSDRPMKHAIESLVDGCDGVRDVDDRLKLMRMPPDAGASDAPPQPHASVPQDSPTARDEARGRSSLPLPGGAGKSG